MYQEILFEVVDPVCTITLNRPATLNAFTSRMQQELRHALGEAERRADVVGIVITGAGRGFCAGVDMGELRLIQAAGSVAAADAQTEFSGARAGDPAMGPDYTRVFTYLLTVRKPIIAAVNGPVAGLGFSLVMFCDLRFAAEDALFTTAYAQRGLVAEHGTSWILPRLIGPARALDVLWSGRRFDGREALQLGVANAALPRERLVDAAQGYIRSLAATCSPASLMQMKRQVYRHLMLPLGEAMEETQALIDESVTLPDFNEGLSSFAERRAPRFARLQA
ncbi:MAG TPA: enoyl-CoA hydratase-related protein [Dehalococcoidia bacterium]|nr:enoyl-CoA hydratase-related protein [Dehalococcoidia bacterium]